MSKVIQIGTLLSTVYSEPGRYYHNINHIKYLLAKAEQWSDDEQTTDYVKRNLCTAIWWHDAYYNIWEKPGLNELESAQMFLECNEPDEGEDHVVYKAILATAKHLEDQELPDDEDGLIIKLMLDVDMAGFAEDYELVKYNSEQVLKEYEPKALPRRTLLEGRIAFLEKLLARKQIFYTDYFFSRYENLARLNIQRQIQDTKKELGVKDKPKSKTTPKTYRAGYKPFINHAGIKGHFGLGTNPFNNQPCYVVRYETGVVRYMKTLDGIDPQ